MQPSQRRRGRLAELGTIGTGHAAEMREAEIEGDVDDARVGGGAPELRVEMRQADIQQHVRDRGAEMALEPELQRADTDAGDGRELREVERVCGMGVEAFPRPPQRAGQARALPCESPDRLRQVMM